MGKSMPSKILPFLALLCQLAAGHALADGMTFSDSVGPGFHIGGDVLIGPAIEYQISSAVAFDGSNYLVVWSDYRSHTSYDIFGTRLAVDGTVLDEGGFLISDADGQQEEPAVTFDGTNYLVVWKDGRNGSDDIYGSRVSPAGGVLDPGGIPICTDPSGQGEVAVAFDDSACLVVWTDLRDGNENIYGARVDGNGAVLDPTGIAICSQAAVQRYPAVTSNGAGWLAVWMDPRNGQPDIYCGRVGSDGSLLDADGIPVATTSAAESYPAVAYNDTTCLVVWDIDAGATSHDIYGARVDSAGAVLDSSGIAISTHPDYQGYPSASSDGANYFVIWVDIRGSMTWNIYGARVDPEGAVVDTAGLPLCLDGSQQFGLAIGFGGPSWLITWHDSRNDHKDIYGIRVATDGTVLGSGSFLVGSSSIDQTEPAVAFDGINYFVVWHEWREGSLYDIRGTRVSMDGTVLDPAGIGISTHIADSMYPAVSCIGDMYLVVWQDYRYNQWDIYGARVMTDGTVVDSTGFPISVATNSQERPALARNDARWFVAWQDRRSGVANDIYGSRVTRERSVYEPTGLLISDAFGHQAHPSVSSDGDTYFIVWEDARNGQNDIIGARVTRGGTVLDTAGINIAVLSYAQERPDLTFDGQRYAVVWQDYRSNVDYDIYLSRINTDGTVLSPYGTMVSTAVGDQRAPSLVFNNRNYVAIWQDGRNQGRYDIYGARVDRFGLVIDPAGFEVSGAPHHQLTPDLSTTPLGVILMCYSSFVPDPGYGSYRMWASLYDVTAGVPVGTAGAGSALLYPNFPNPFRGSTTLRFSLAQETEVSLKVYDVYGRLVATLMEESRDAGLHSVTWDTGSAEDRALAPGLYFLRLSAGTHHEARKMLLLK